MVKICLIFKLSAYMLLMYHVSCQPLSPIGLCVILVFLVINKPYNKDICIHVQIQGFSVIQYT